MTRAKTVLALAVTALLCSAATAGASHLITGKQIAPSTITGRNVKDGSLTAADFKGPVAVNGTNGAPGHDGAGGQNGLNGRDGTNGTNGTGANGANGATGAAGPKGDTGATGSKGDTGATGSQGSNGADAHWQVVSDSLDTVQGDHGANVACPAGMHGVAGGGYGSAFGSEARPTIWAVIPNENGVSFNYNAPNATGVVTLWATCAS